MSVKEGDANLGGLFDDLVNGDDLAFCFEEVGLIQCLAARRRNERTQRVMCVVVPHTVVVVLGTHRAATL